MTNRETNTRLNTYTNMSSISENLVKISLVVSEIYLLQSSVKKKKMKEVTEAKRRPISLLAEAWRPNDRSYQSYTIG